MTKITERGMIFNGEMVRAILDGRKTQTRRAVSDRHLHMIDVASQAGECYPLDSGTDHSNSQSYYREWCPFGAIGDRIWVRETWQAIYDSVDEFGHVEERTYAPSIPKENDNYWHIVYAEYFGNESREDRGFPWRPAIHMPRWASRITLEITDVRVERLNAISPEDAESEGLECTNFTGFGDEPGLPSYPEPDVYFDPLKKQWKEYPPEAFAGLWESIYGEGSWQANPWVWVIEFKRVKGGAA